MSTYRPAPASEVPLVNLSRWRVKKITSSLKRLGTAIVLVGTDEATGDGRVSSQVKKFDPKTRQAITSTGRVYQLVGPSGMTLDAAYVFGVWCKKWRVTADVDITARYEKKARKPKAGRKQAA